MYIPSGGSGHVIHLVVSVFSRLSRILVGV